jgi:NDP-sugar pyrophosphorylase family protein
MLPVANKPILDYTIERLARAGIDEAIITTNYLRERIDEHVGKANYPISVVTVEENEPLGTAGAVKNVADRIDGNFLVVQGDAISSLDLGEQVRSHKGVATISLTKVENPSSYGIAELDRGGMIKRFLEKPGPDECFSNLANTGTYSFSYEALDAIPSGRSDFSLDIFPKLLADKKPVYGIVQEGYWKDVGSIGNYFSSNRYMLGGLLSGKISEKAFISRSAKLAPPFVIGDGAQIGADAFIGPNTVVGNHCSIGSGSNLSGVILHDSVKIGSGCKVENCIIGDKCELSDGVFIGSRAVIGSGCIMERNARISSNSIVGPIIKVQASTEVQGILSPNIEKIQKVSSILNTIPIFKKLERNELQICMALVEFGELRDDVLANLSKIPKDQIDRSLTRLQKLGIIRAKEGEFYLLYEEPERVYDYLKKHLL